MRELKLMVLLAGALSVIACGGGVPSDLSDLDLPAGEKILLTTASAHNADNPFAAFVYPDIGNKQLNKELGESLLLDGWDVAIDTSILAARKDGNVILAQTTKHSSGGVLALQSVRTGLWKVDQACAAIVGCCSFLHDELSSEDFKDTLCDLYADKSFGYVCRTNHSFLRTHILVETIESSDDDFLTTCLPIMVNDKTAAFLNQ